MRTAVGAGSPARKMASYCRRPGSEKVTLRETVH